MAWQRMSERMAGVKPDGPYEGVPAHLKYPLIAWLRERFSIDKSSGNEKLLRTLAVRFRWTLPLNVSLRAHAQGLIDNAAGGDASYDVDEADEDKVTNHEFFLDLIDATLHALGKSNNNSRALNQLLSDGASVWRVSEDRESLTRIVTKEAQATFEAATAIPDEPANELKEAWANAFGRNGDPSDAWDHAIKAVEDVLIPVVVPKKAKPNLGDVLGQLGSPQSAASWRMVIPGADKSHDVAPLVSILRLIWPNHDRHGGTADKRTPAPEEARAVVTLAATIVQWHREGWVVQKR